MIIDIVIPAFNEEESIPLVLADIDKSLVSNVIVVNNNSTDNTVEAAENAGAIVVHETHQGYGAACLKGIAHVNQTQPRADIIVFMDADYSDYGEEISQLVEPIISGEVDFTIGSRALGKREKGAMMPQQLFGNWLATGLLKLFYGVRFSDLGPFRAIRLSTLNALQMKDQDFGWTVEMQIKIAKQKIPYKEFPARYRKRVGVSKITGTLKGTILAGYKIIYTLIKYR
ncbi:MAG: glycosyltransferase family 2 protein [Flavobacteriales bacterium]